MATNQQLTPILKWAGGKNQLIEYISQVLPQEFGTTITKYAEPFVGGGAILFYILQNYDLDEIYISDINAELINMYIRIQDNVDEVISLLRRYEETYLPLPDYERRTFYYEKRDEFNELMLNANEINAVMRASLFIFLNRTCFNGIYRVNKKGQYNVPMGVNKNPTICNVSNLKAVSKALNKVNIVCGSYLDSEDFIDQSTLVYFDPPYRPLKGMDNFTSYTEDDFDDDAQKELAEYVRHISSKGAHFILSNSDPKSSDPEDDFFDELYSEYNIQRISAKRIINRNVDSRGSITEILVSN